MEDFSPEELLAKYPSEIQAIANELRKLVKTVAPEVSERAYAGWKLIKYEDICYVSPHNRWVRLGFMSGDRIPDPAGLLQTGQSKEHRFVKLEKATEVHHPDLKTLIQAAFEAAKQQRRVGRYE
ncbi:MAG: DUF1801 domain-containing protein [Actinomycetota bacterium]